ncbi:MAG: D-aminoacyl-tRNA deacylase [Candidatus Neomarinimicrobiota bacterium]|jgi:D-tyrosyl-tRNA(Tyr) deacylase|nr:D-aminoacyl-tRNA deacylase [Candidatus Neomarinimicrobiota bacterium]
MIAVLQRVTTGKVKIGDRIIGDIDNGLVILLGVHRDDKEEDIIFLADKIIGLRVFDDNNGKMNISLQDAKGSILVISQFTLCGDWRKGRRPSFTKAADPDKGKFLYDGFINAVRSRGINVETGEFGAAMDVSLINSGPVTFVLDSHDR